MRIFAQGVETVGRLLILAGVLTFLFAAFQLWGTSFTEQQAQAQLDVELEAMLAAAEAPTEPTQPSGPLPSAADLAATGSASAEAPQPAPALATGPDTGDVFGRISIPKIGVEKTLIEGVNREDLMNGPGHYPDTPLPGQAGNAGVAGHRTTYGQPFHDLDQLVPGDLIQVETVQGEFTYEVQGHSTNENGAGQIGHQIVGPEDVSVLDDFGDNRLTLTACHPKYSAAERIIVSATLADPPAPPTERPESNENEPDVTFEDSLGWNYEETRPTTFWGGGLATALGVAWFAGFRWRRSIAYTLFAPAIVVSTWYFFQHLDRLLPAV